MMKNNKLKKIISSVVILLPMLFGIIMWNKLPDTMITHWGADGNADRVSTKVFMVFGLPVILLVFHLVCICITTLDKQQKGQNKKALGIIYWIIPFISLFTGVITYATAFGKTFSIQMLIPIMLSIMFIFIGNYLPKIKRNRTLGIKVSWTVNNEENWNKTHRFGGKVWVIGGLFMLFSVFMPSNMIIEIMFGVMLVVIIIPIIYSYSIYRKHKKAGIIYDTAPKSKLEKRMTAITAIVVPVILIGVVILMFTGNIDVNCEDTSFNIHATYWNDLEVDYSKIDTVEYRKGLDLGTRINGFGSARLSMGTFQNDTFGAYTLYSYNGAKEFVVLTSGKNKLVIGLKEAGDTQEFYKQILAKKNV